MSLIDPVVSAIACLRHSPPQRRASTISENRPPGVLPDSRSSIDYFVNIECLRISGPPWTIRLAHPMETGARYWIQHTPRCCTHAPGATGDSVLRECWRRHGARRSFRIQNEGGVL